MHQNFPNSFDLNQNRPKSTATKSPPHNSIEPRANYQQHKQSRPNYRSASTSLQECNCVSGCYDGARFGFILCKARRARSGKMWLNSRDREFVLFRIGQIRAKICSFTASANSIKRRYRRTNSCTLAVIWRLMGPLGFQWRRMQKPC